MKIEDFLTIPDVYYDTEDSIPLRSWEHQRIINYRFWKHLQVVSKIEPMPMIFADHDIGGFMTVHQWDNGRTFYVFNTYLWLPDEIGATRFVWTFPVKTRYTVNSIETFMARIRGMCMSYRKFAILTTVEGRVISISDQGIDRVLTSDAERIFRASNGSVRGNYS